MKVSLKKAFSIIDGRLTTNMDDVVDMMNYIFDEDFCTHQLPTATATLQLISPEWYKNGIDLINNIKHTNKTDNFEELMEIIDNNFSTHQIELFKLLTNKK